MVYVRKYLRIYLFMLGNLKTKHNGLISPHSYLEERKNKKKVPRLAL